MSKFSENSTGPGYEAGKKRREIYLAAIREGRTHEDAMALTGCKERTFRSWCEKYPTWKNAVHAVRAQLRNVEAGMDENDARRWVGGFADFRKAFFGFDSEWFHLLIVDALEQANPGEITLITIPPEHGKTTLLEDFFNYKLAMVPTFRIMVGSEKQAHSKKILKRVKGRMDEGSTFKSYVERFGPFRAPQGHPRRSSQVWTATEFDILGKEESDERDFSMVALGMGSAVPGTRTDLLAADDPQSRKSLAQTQELFEIFRQDWLSRPGALAPTVVVGTRQGEDDIYDAMLDADIVARHIILPAFSESDDPERAGWLWPSRYDEDAYARMKKNVGQDAWDHNYMQIARPKHTIVFTRDAIERGRDHLCSIVNPFPERRLRGAHGVMVGLDPGYGVTGIAAAIDGPKFEIVLSRKRRNLPGTEAIIAELEDAIHTVHGEGHPVTDVIIETKAFQRGLATDLRVLELQRRYGFRVLGHETGDNKYDIDFGVPQMVHSLLREEITWPWADEISQRELGELEADMYRWRPGKGTKREQDSLMAAWFCWLHWRMRARARVQTDASQFNFGGAPSVKIGRIA